MNDARLSAVRVTLSCLAVSVAAGMAAGCGGGPPQIGADIALEVGDERVAYRAFERYLERNLGRVDVTSDRPSDVVLSQLFDRFVDEHLLVRLAAGAGFEDAFESEDRRQPIAFLLEQALGRERIDDDAVRAYYEANAEAYRQGARVHLWQILVGRRSLAEDAVSAIASGERFESVAARVATDPDANFCGDQGLLEYEDLPESLADVVFSLDVGATSEILEADLGFYVFQVVARTPPKVIDLESAAATIRETLRRDRLAELELALIDEARARYNVRIFASNLPFDYQGSYDQLG